MMTNYSSEIYLFDVQINLHIQIGTIKNGKRNRDDTGLQEETTIL